MTTVRLAMKYAEVEVGQVDNLIMDDEVVFEQKFDGTRVMAVIRRGTAGNSVTSLQSGGKVLAHTAATQHLDGIRPTLLKLADLFDVPGETVLDGELMISSGEYHLFDVPSVLVGGVAVIKPTDPYYKRRAWLRGADLAQLIYGTKVHVTEQATTRHEKKRLLDAVRDAGGEGVMAKNIFHPYLPGKRSKEAVKLKFVKTADVVVWGVDRPDPRHGNFKLGAYDDEGTFHEVGGASAIGKDTSIEVGSVVEVAYLYYTGKPGNPGSLYQPRVMRKRTDKEPQCCKLDQFPAYSRATINLSGT